MAVPAGYGGLDWNLTKFRLVFLRTSDQSPHLTTTCLGALIGSQVLLLIRNS